MTRQLAKGETLEANGRVIRHADGALENILACNYPHYNAKGEVIDVGSSEENPLPTSHSWIEDVNVVSPTSYGELNATWIVPPAPTSNDGQTVFFFPGMQDASQDKTILQPVLGWVGGQWSIASWNCCTNGVTTGSTPVNVNAGDSIYGTIKDTCNAGALSCAGWNITTKDVNSGKSTSLTNSTSYGQTFDWAFSGALEVY